MPRGLNLVAMTTSSRRRPSALPENSSDLPPPYISAVSKWVIPTSRAASTTARVWAASIRIPKLLQPSPTTETAGPSTPRRRASMPVPPVVVGRSPAAHLLNRAVQPDPMPCGWCSACLRPAGLAGEVMVPYGRTNVGYGFGQSRVCRRRWLRTAGQNRRRELHRSRTSRSRKGRRGPVRTPNSRFPVRRRSRGGLVVQSGDELVGDDGCLSLEKTPALGVPTLVTSPMANTSGNEVSSVSGSTGTQPSTVSPDSATTAGTLWTGTPRKRSKGMSLPSANTATPRSGSRRLTSRSGYQLMPRSAKAASSALMRPVTVVSAHPTASPGRPPSHLESPAG